MYSAYIERNFALLSALGIVVDSPQRRYHARTCNVKPDPFGERYNEFYYRKKFQTRPNRIVKSR
jgi:hypothetical protein